MKLFSELGSCFHAGSGATVAPAADISSTNSSTSAEGLRKAKTPHKSRHWKPKLHVISEDNAVDSWSAARSNEKSSVKAKAKPKQKVSSSNDYRKASSLWAVPAFSPTPFAF